LQEEVEIKCEQQEESKMLDVIEGIKKEGFRRKLSHQTIKAYVYYVKDFFSYCKKEPNELTKKDVKDYLDQLAARELSGNTLNVALNSVRFLLDWVLFKRWRLHIKYSKVPKALPTVLTKDEIVKMINATLSVKHRLIISLMYSAGLRVSELINLRVRDLEMDKNFGWVRGGKGNKDRMFIIAEKLNEKLRNWIADKNLTYDSYLFYGRNHNSITDRTIYAIVKNSAKRTDILKNVHPHTLRHSFATHLIENGYGVSSVQSLLGHVSAETTMVYVHMSSPRMINVKSPYDSLE
jgi:site-specific recombinase XerD